MTDLVRQEVMTSASRVVIKVGTRVLTDQTGKLHLDRIQALSKSITDLRVQGKEVVLVSSGAVGAGMGEMGLEQRPRDVASLQALASIGQARLMNVYNQTFRERGFHAAQVLLTAADLDRRDRYLNIRNAMLKLLELKTIPIVNENDSVAVDELVATFGDNDRLAALVTTLLGASLLVILSDVDGLYDGDPEDPSSKLVPLVSSVSGSHYDWVSDKKTGLSKGGMASKLEAARMVTSSGGCVVVASGREPATLETLFDAETLGTLFLAQGKAISPRKRWLGFSAASQGQLKLDEGAVRAVRQNGKSLLAIGVSEAKGNFSKGDVVTLVDDQGVEVARGLTNYDGNDMRRIVGLKSSEIAQVLGHIPYEEVVHRDNLLIR